MESSMEPIAIFAAPKPKPSFVLRPRHEDILLALYRYEYLNIQHIKRLFFGARTDNYGYPLMQDLRSNGYCYAAEWHKPKAGRGEHQYHLDAKGINWLKRNGHQPKARLRKDSLPESNRHWDHLVSLNHVLISLSLFADNHPQVTEQLFLHDFDFKRRRYQVTVADGSTKTVMPDGLYGLVLSVTGETEKRGLLIECDRDSEKRPSDWFEKIDKLTAFIRQHLLTDFGLQAVDVAVTTPNTKRRDVLRAWTKEALATLKPPDEAAQFYFTSADPEGMSPAAFVVSPHWYFLMEDTPLPLLDVDMSKEGRTP